MNLSLKKLEVWQQARAIIKPENNHTLRDVLFPNWICFLLTMKCLQPVSKPVEQDHSLGGWEEGGKLQSPFGVKALQPDNHAGLTKCTKFA